MFFAKAASGGIPRGLAESGPAVLSYGFRPFFLLAGIWAVLAMVLWVITLTTGFPAGGALGGVNWHAHEMVFGYTSAVLAGFMLTAIPNWTGRLPVSGLPLLALVLVWLAGRLALLAPDLAGLELSLVVDAAFLPALTVVAMREIVAGRNWKNLKILFGLLTLSTANIWFLASVYLGEDPSAAARLAVGAWVVLIAVVGGRIVPSFTRNWMSRHGNKKLPAPFGRFDQLSVVLLLVALMAWTVAPQGYATAALSCLAAAANFIRLVRWRGYSTTSEPIVLVLHVAYLFLVVGLVMIALSALQIVEYAAAMHVLLIGCVGGMTLAVMTRASLGHTGRPIRAGALATAAYVNVFLAAAIRPLVAVFPQHYYFIFSVSGLLWIFAFAAFTAAYLPILMSPRLSKRA